MSALSLRIVVDEDTAGALLSDLPNAPRPLEVTSSTLGDVVDVTEVTYVTEVTPST
jgi:hypothetical protein